MSESNDRQSVDKQQTPQARSRRRFLVGVLTGGLLGSVLAGGVSLYAQAQPGPGCGLEPGAVRGAFSTRCLRSGDGKDAGRVCNRLDTESR